MSPRMMANDAVRATAMPTSFNGSELLLGSNLFLTTAFFYVGLMIAGAMYGGIWRNLKWDKFDHPVTLWRLSWAFAASALTIRCGAEAAVLWSWNPEDATTATLMQIWKRRLDPISLVFAGGWIILVVLSGDAMIQQLRKQPFPVSMWARRHALLRPIGVVILSAVMAYGVVLTRG